MGLFCNKDKTELVVHAFLGFVEWIHSPSLMYTLLMNYWECQDISGGQN